jgi:hypothetical protein
LLRVQTNIIFTACADAAHRAGHAIEVCPQGEWDNIEILCGACGTELTIGGIWHVPTVAQPVANSSIPDATTTITSTSRRYNVSR